jgi:hypothetical protein
MAYPKPCARQACARSYFLACFADSSWGSFISGGTRTNTLTVKKVLA